MSENMSEKNLIAKIEQEYQEFKANTDKPNVILIGGTGVGKSSLVNMCFGEDIAAVGVGKPVTEHMDFFNSNSVPVGLFDTKGYEIGSEKEKQFMREVLDYTSSFGDEANKIHLAWYCIKASGARIVDFDVQSIKSLQSNNIPVAIVLTKAELISEEDSQKFKEVIRSLLPNICIFETSVIDMQRKWDFDKLCAWSVEQLPESLKTAFISAQKQNLSLKMIAAKKIVKQHSVAAAPVGFVPIPLSDAPILIGNQVAMVARIVFIYNLESLKSILTTSLVGKLLAEALKTSGKWLVGQLIKFFPGLGTVAGGIINAAVATTITYAFGISIAQLCEKIYLNALNGTLDNIKDITPIFEEIFKNNMTNTNPKNE